MDTIRLRFVGHLAKFKNLDESEQWENHGFTSSTLKENQDFLTEGNVRIIPSEKWEQIPDDDIGILGSDDFGVEEDF